MGTWGRKAGPGGIAARGKGQIDGARESQQQWQIAACEGRGTEGWHKGGAGHVGAGPGHSNVNSYLDNMQFKQSCLMNQGRMNGMARRRAKEVGQTAIGETSRHGERQDIEWG
jgi:hypothetical protein